MHPGSVRRGGASPTPRRAPGLPSQPAHLQLTQLLRRLESNTAIEMKETLTQVWDRGYYDENR